MGAVSGSGTADTHCAVCKSVVSSRIVVSIQLRLAASCTNAIELEFDLVDDLCQYGLPKTARQLIPAGSDRHRQRRRERPDRQRARQQAQCRCRDGRGQNRSNARWLTRVGPSPSS